MTNSSDRLHVVVLGAHQLTRSMHREIVLLLKHSPQYCFIAQRCDSPAAVAVIRATGLQSAGDPFDDQADPAASVRSAAVALLQQCAHCVFAAVDFSLPSAASLVAAAVEAGAPVYIMHSVAGLYRAYLTFSKAAGDKNSAPARDDVSSSAELIRKLNIIHMVGDLQQHFTVMNWAISRLDDLRDRLLLQYVPPGGGDSSPQSDGLFLADEGCVASSDATDILTKEVDESFKAFCMSCFEPPYEEESMKPPTSSHKGRSRRAGRLVYINETGLLSLRDMGSSAAVAGGGGEDVSIPPNSEPNSLAKLLSFSSYYYGEGKEHGEVALFDDVSPGDVAPGDGSVGRSRASKRRRSDPAESTDNWVPAVHPVRPGAVQTEVEDATLSRQNSVVPPLLSQISVISNSGDDVAAGANVRNDSEAGIPSSWSLLGRGLSQIDVEDEAIACMMSQETEATVIEDV